jgi:chalcone isomerase-like protein
LLFALTPHVPACAAELEGVNLDDRVRVDGRELQLNGLALRTRFIFKVYVAGLYLSAKANSANEAIYSRGPKRIILVMMRDASAEQFVESIDSGMRANNSEAQIAAVKTQIEELTAMIRAVGQSKAGARIVLDYAPSDGGTTLFVDGVAQGKPMAGEAFYQVLLRIWLGEDPVQPDLKEALLGGSQ